MGFTCNCRADPRTPVVSPDTAPDATSQTGHRKFKAFLNSGLELSSPVSRWNMALGIL